jgi:hypothetical protein
MPFWMHFLLGYILSVAVATFVTLTILFAQAAFHSGAHESFFSIYLVGFTFTFVTGFPGFVLAIYLGSIGLGKSHPHWVMYGVLNAILANGIFMFFGAGILFGEIGPYTLVGGGVAGLAYSFFRRHNPYR